jgi:hypothetical protein
MPPCSSRDAGLPALFLCPRRRARAAADPQHCAALRASDTAALRQRKGPLELRSPAKNLWVMLSLPISQKLHIIRLNLSGQVSAAVY